MMLAPFESAAYATLTQSMEPGDRLVLYTDGLLEATNTQKEEFGSTRLNAVVRNTGNHPLTEAADEFISAV